MAKITYTPRHNGDPIETEWAGVKFYAGKAVEVDGRTKEGKALIPMAKMNPWFDVDGETNAPPPAAAPTTAEEYRAYAIAWINGVRTRAELDARWASEAKMRDELGWGTDDEALIEPFLEPRRELLKAAEG